MNHFNNLIAVWTPALPELIVILGLLLFLLVIPVVLILVVVFYLIKQNKEKQRMKEELENIKRKINKEV